MGKVDTTQLSRLLATTEIWRLRLEVCGDAGWKIELHVRYFSPLVRLFCKAPIQFGIHSWLYRSNVELIQGSPTFHQRSIMVAEEQVDRVSDRLTGNWAKKVTRSGNKSKKTEGNEREALTGDNARPPTWELNVICPHTLMRDFENSWSQCFFHVIWIENFFS